MTRIDQFLVHARKRREEMMRSLCRIVRAAGERVWDPVSGTYSDPGETVVYDGICQVKPSFSPAERDHDSGEREVMLQAYDVVVPLVGTATVEVGDTVIVYESDDTWVIDKRMPVGWVEHADTRTARHLTAFTQDRPAVKNA